MYYEDYISKEDAFDNYRSGFANYVCKLVYNKSDNDIHIAINECEEISEHFYECVRNFYECVEEVPLLNYYELINGDPEDRDLSNEEYEDLKVFLINKCEEFYYE